MTDPAAEPLPGPTAMPWSFAQFTKSDTTKKQVSYFFFKMIQQPVYIVRLFTHEKVYRLYVSLLYFVNNFYNFVHNYFLQLKNSILIAIVKIKKFRAVLPGTKYKPMWISKKIVIVNYCKCLLTCYIGFCNIALIIICIRTCKQIDILIIYSI